MEKIEIKEVKKACQIVTIKSLTTLYKNGEPANAIELAHVEEHNFDIVVGKGLYVVGDKAVYIQPDYSVPLLSEKDEEITMAQLMFREFTQPDGNPQKSKLGKQGRIRAIKFNFNVDPTSVDPVFSFGIMLPVNEVVKLMQVDELPEDLDIFLEVTKYEEPETAYSGLSKGDLPIGMYATDEPNIMNLTRTQYPITLTGTIKVDGSSTTQYFKSDEDKGICSRNLEKSLDQSYVNGYETETGEKIRKHILFNKDTKEKTLGWINETTNDFFLEPKDEWKKVVKEVDDTFVKLGKPILEKLAEYCKTHGLQLALRGELSGEGLKGSGNKNNPHTKLKQSIRYFGVDDFSKGVTRKMPLTDFYRIINDLGLEHCEIVFKDKTFNSFEEIKETCLEYFKSNMIEGIVLRDENCYFSAKFMNPDYDAKK